MQGNQSTVDPAEVAKFEAMAAEWWDLEGKFKPLHMLNPCRLDYITQQISMEFDRDLSADLPFKGLRILDIGCGGGLLCEPMARLGATVVGADAAAGNIPVAKLHAEQSGLEIDYRHITAEALAEANEQFDVVLNIDGCEAVNVSDLFAGLFDAKITLQANENSYRRFANILHDMTFCAMTSAKSDVLELGEVNVQKLLA